MKNMLAKLFFDKNVIANDYKGVVTSIAYLLLLCSIFYYAREVVNGGNGWKTGDWLINYEGGLIRRGLIGQALYEISGFGVSILWSTFVLQVLIYISIAYLVLKLFFSTRREVSWLLIIFSPAFIFLFPFYNFEGGFRKEIIVFLSFCLLAVGLMQGKFNQKYIFVSLFVYTVAVFSHELAALCLIFFLYLLHVSTRFDPALRNIGKAYILGFCIVGTAGLLFSLIHTGNAEIAKLICDTLKNQSLIPRICNGAILWLSFDSSYGYKQVIEHIPRYLFIYIPLFILSVIPLVATNWWKGKLPILLIGFVSLLPLYFIAIDWGRFIHIYIFLVFVLLLYDSGNVKVKIYKLPPIAILAYASLWSIPHCCFHRPTLGLYDFHLKMYIEFVLGVTL